MNTLKIAVVGIVLATVLGTLVGIARLSRNWLLSKIAGVYVEVIRDLPLLLQLLFWYAIMQALPGPRQAMNPVEGVFLSNRGLKLPWLEWQDAHSYAVLAFVAGAVGHLVLGAAGEPLRMQDGKPRPVWPVALGLLIGLPLVVWMAFGAPWTVDWPALRGFNFRGGLTMTPGVLRAAGGPRALHRGLHRRDRARRHPGGAARAVGGGAGARACGRARC